MILGRARMAWGARAIFTLLFISSVVKAAPSLQSSQTRDALYDSLSNKVLLLTAVVAHPVHSWLFRYSGFVGWSDPEFRLQVTASLDRGATIPHYEIDVVDMKEPLIFAVDDLWKKGVRDEDTAWQKLPMQHVTIDMGHCPEAMKELDAFQSAITKSASAFHLLDMKKDGALIMVDGGFEYEASITDDQGTTLSMSTWNAQSPVVRAADRLTQMVSSCSKTSLRHFRTQ